MQGGGWGPPPGPPPGGYGQPPPGQNPYAQQNPYQAPNPYAQQQPYGYGPMPIANPYALCCPRCRGPNVVKPTFTFWGGILGPKLLSHAVCQSCGFGFNWKTGKSNTTGIIIYYAVIIGIVVVIGVINAASN